MYLYKKSKFRLNFIVFIVIGTICGCVIGFMINNKYFDQESIDKKYCYCMIEDKILGVEMPECKEQAFLHLHYYISLILKKPTQLNVYESVRELKIDEKIDVLEYTDDSLLARIRVNIKSDLSGGMSYDVVGYVPFFALHDTLPSNIKLFDK